MTGTAETKAAEFHDIYKLDGNMIPNEPAGAARTDQQRSHLQDAPRKDPTRSN